jgi:hypothetical protein
MATAKKLGRHPHEPTEKEAAQVKTLAGMGINADDIGKVVGLSAPTIRKYFMHELEVGQIEATAMVAQSLYRQATKGHVTACIFFLKCKGGWKEDGDGLGKKELADLLAKVAQKGTDWDQLLQT